MDFLMAFLFSRKSRGITHAKSNDENWQTTGGDDWNGADLRPAVGPRKGLRIAEARGQDTRGVSDAERDAAADDAEADSPGRAVSLPGVRISAQPGRVDFRASAGFG